MDTSPVALQPVHAAHSPRLRAALAVCRSLCDPAHARADGAAVRRQREHRAIVDVVAVSGTVAILAGIAPLANLVSGGALKVVEALAAVTALVAVGFGLYARSQRRWLLERHRAERLRSLEYRALTELAADPALPLERWSERLAADVTAIDRLTTREMHEWLTQEDAPDVSGRCADAVALAELVQLYRSGRLREQCAYFKRRADDSERADRVTHVIVTVLFFVSVGAIVPASGVRLFGGPPGLALALLAIAAAGPAVATGIRLVRSAHEFARNSTRFRAKYRTLHALEAAFESETDPARQLQDVARAEALLEGEHREWLRLMLDAEWYG